MMSVNNKTVSHAAICLFNHLLCFDGDKKQLVDDLSDTMKTIIERIGDKSIDD
jgi:hypothetical protein